MSNTANAVSETIEAPTSRPIRSIARDICAEWGSQGKGVNFAAKPYLGAMLTLSTLNDRYGADSARSVIDYFLCDARPFRGDRARGLKAELRGILANK